jgi:hypothetical protein
MYDESDSSGVAEQIGTFDAYAQIKKFARQGVPVSDKGLDWNHFRNTSRGVEVLKQDGLSRLLSLYTAYSKE